MATDQEFALLRQSGALADQVRLLGGSSPTATLWEQGHTLAARLPDAPSRSMATVTTAVDPDALYDIARAYTPELTRWSLRVVQPDPPTIDLMERTGYFVSRHLNGMGLDLTSFLPHELGALDFSYGETADLGGVNALAYHDGSDYISVFRQDPANLPLRVYRARYHGQIASVAATIDHSYPDGDDCGIHYVATVRAFRGLGLATRLVSLALSEAKERGCVTATLQAGPDAESVYAGLGFRRSWKVLVFATK